MEIRAGNGYDVHRFDEARELYLGGVKIPFDKGLKGHSDADVLLHALMDALLGAAGLGDIGRHFPDSDEAYAGISSAVLLEKVAVLIAEKGFSVGNIDVTVICEEPKISIYTEEMKRVIAQTMSCDADQINIKGTTTEGLGFTGRKEGIACIATCIIYEG